MLYSTDAVLLKVRRNHDFRLKGELPESVTREFGSRIENLIQQHAIQKTQT
jgi:citrate lyase gamma subunit